MVVGVGDVELGVAGQLGAAVVLQVVGEFLPGQVVLAADEVTQGGGIEHIRRRRRGRAGRSGRRRGGAGSCLPGLARTGRSQAGVHAFQHTACFLDLLRNLSQARAQLVNCVPQRLHLRAQGVHLEVGVGLGFLDALFHVGHGALHAVDCIHGLLEQSLEDGVFFFVAALKFLDLFTQQRHVALELDGFSLLGLGRRRPD